MIITDQQIAKIIDLLDDALIILTKDIPGTPVPLPLDPKAEWNKSPIGRAVEKIELALIAIEKLDDNDMEHNQ